MHKIPSVVPVIVCLMVQCSTQTRGAAFTEDFASNPMERGWKLSGETGLFEWDAARGALRVTWDSSKPNSFFYRPLDTILARTDDFSLAFDLRLDDIAIGVDPEKPYTFQIAVGLIHRASATGTNFIRGTGFDSPNLVEFDYFPDSGFGATLSTPLISAANEFNEGGFTFPLELETNVVYHVAMNYTASNQTLRTMLSSNGIPIGPLDPATLGEGFTDFRVDAVAVSSYSDVGQDPLFAGSVLAHGVVDNLVVATPSPALADLVSSYSNNIWRTEFTGRSNWTYTLERTTDFGQWNDASAEEAGSGGTLALQDTNPPAGRAFYRLRAERP